MGDIKERLGVVRSGVERLIKERDEQRAKVAKLTAQMHDENGMLDVLRKRIGELEHENKVLRTAQTFQGADGKGSKQQIDMLVKEIDRCLSLLKA